ncbi:MAG UNVERIFIED_CONTAM: hypothetical protein LVR18_42950 [Planctomycetaceae bacterium]
MIANVFEVKGRVELAWVDGGFDMEFDGVLDLAGFDALTVEGGAQIRDGHFAAYTDIGVGNISIPMVTIQGDFELEVNTSDVLLSRSANAPFNPATCRILIGATIQILGFELKRLTVILGVENGVFGIELKDLKLNFFNFIDVNINGYVRSNGEFMFEGSIDIECRSGALQALRRSRRQDSRMIRSRAGSTAASTSPWILGSSRFSSHSPPCGQTSKSRKPARSAELEVTVAGFTARRKQVAWSWGPPPVIARQEGGTLKLNVGPDAHLRGEDYKDVTNESYNIRPGKKLGEIVVSSMGEDNNLLRHHQKSASLILATEKTSSTWIQSCFQWR